MNGEKFLLLEFDVFPRRIRENYVKAALGKHLRELQRPMEEAMGQREIPGRRN